MKKVIIDNNLAEINVKRVSNDKFYGVRMRKDVGFLMQRRYCDGDFIIVSQEGLTRGNFYSVESGYFDKPYTNLEDAINYIQTERSGQVFEFDTFKELTQWLTSNNNE